jgi:hypothetical protein
VVEGGGVSDRSRTWLSGEVRDALAAHLVFTLAAVAAIIVPLGALGLRLSAVTVLYAALMLGVGFTRQPGFLSILRLVMPLSVFQVLPDWFLSAQLHVLDFADTGAPRVGTVPLFMAGLWTVPLFVAVLCAQQVAARRPEGSGLPALVGAAVATALFVGSEATLWAVPIWEARGVAQVAHVALYIIAPEALLGWATVVAWRETRTRSFAHALGAAALVSTLYTGAAALSHFLLEAQ